MTGFQALNEFSKETWLKKKKKYQEEKQQMNQNPLVVISALVWLWG